MTCSGRSLPKMVGFPQRALENLWSPAGELVDNSMSYDLTFP